MFLRRIIASLVVIAALTIGLLFVVGTATENADGLIEKGRAACTRAGTSILDLIGQDTDFSC